MSTNSTVEAPNASVLKEMSKSMTQLYDACDEVLDTDEYSHDRILHAVSETFDKASDLARAGLLSPDEYQDCLAMRVFMSDALFTLLELRARLAERVNTRSKPWKAWK